MPSRPPRGRPGLMVMVDRRGGGWGRARRRSAMTRPVRPPLLPAPIAGGAVDSLADAIVIVGTDGGVLHVNPAAEELFGRSRERAAGLPVRALPGGVQLALLADKARDSHESATTGFPSPREP